MPGVSRNLVKFVCRRGGQWARSKLDRAVSCQPVTSHRCPGLAVGRQGLASASIPHPTGPAECLQPYRCWQSPGGRTGLFAVGLGRGRMSENAAGTLIKQGYTNIWKLDGGMIAWEKAGLPIEGK